MNRDSWAVTVERNGEQVVTLSSNHLAGRDLTADDERTIRTAARHLLAFLGEAELDNHHNALACPYCNPNGLQLATPEVCICAAIELPSGRIIRGHGGYRLDMLFSEDLY